MIKYEQLKHLRDDYVGVRTTGYPDLAVMDELLDAVRDRDMAIEELKREIYNLLHFCEGSNSYDRAREEAQSLLKKYD